jgi:hypothetical protein
MKSEAAFYALARRRLGNPVREARRQSELSRMQRRVIDFVPTYVWTHNGRGEVVAGRYTGHRAVIAGARR